MPVDVAPIRCISDLRSFVEVPWQIYRGDPCWVPMLRRDIRRKLDRSVNPFFEHGQAEFFLARRDGRVVGRLAAMSDDSYLAVHDEHVGYFGFFECVRDSDVAGQLFTEAAGWLRARGLNIMRGPINYSMNEECGLLIGPFDRPPSIMMPYNPPYYVDLIEGSGFKKVKDLFAYEAGKDNPLPDRVVELIEFATERLGVRTRPFDKRQSQRDIAIIRDIYHSAWASHWGFIPMTDREVGCMAAELLRIADPDLVRFAELEGEPVGFILVLPDWNQALKWGNGRLFPIGWARILWHSRSIDAVRALAFGVKPAYRRQGVDLLLGYEAYKVGIAKGYSRVEMSWVPEDLELHIRALKHIGARLSKRYRIYDRRLDSHA
ncbi:MAG: N-acetyltransferase [Phycisphaerae bacterium]